MRILIIIILICSSISYSCMNLDSMAFVNDTSITSYKLDGYEGETELTVPVEYAVSEDMLNFFVVQSQTEGESESYGIHGLYVGDMSTITSDTIIVYCHGQSKHMDYYWPRANLLANCGGKYRYGMLMMDYRGYGLSEGEPSEKGMFADVMACLNWLKDQGVSQENVIIYGFSLGTAPATYIAAYNDDFKPSKLILESPFSSANNLAQESTIINFQVSFIVTLELNNAEIIKDVDQPLCWFHGEADDYIAISNGQVVYDNYAGVYGEAHKIEGAKHGKDGVPQTMGFENYLDTLNEFIMR